MLTMDQIIKCDMKVSLIVTNPQSVISLQFPSAQRSVLGYFFSLLFLVFQPETLLFGSLARSHQFHLQLQQA